jgi:hypothetical protein
MSTKWFFVAAALLLVTASCAGLSGHPAEEEVAIVVGTVSEGVLVDDQGTTYMLADTEAGKEALTHSGQRVIVTGHISGKKGKQIIEVTSYQLWKQPGDSGKEDDSD